MFGNITAIYRKKEQESNKLTLQLKEKEIELEKLKCERKENDV